MQFEKNAIKYVQYNNQMCLVSFIDALWSMQFTLIFSVLHGITL